MATTYNHFPQAAEAFHEALTQTVKKAAFDIQAHAAKNAPVETGFLRNSIYVTAAWGSTYAEDLERVTAPPSGLTKSGKPRKLSAKKQAVKDKMQTDLLPEIAADPYNDHEAWIGVGASYGIYLEMGTRHMAPKPYLAPAVESVRDTFETALERIEDAMKARGL